MRPRIYLAGAIRDGNTYDYLWREWATEHLSPYAEVLNPLNGKRLGEDKVWRAHGMVVSDASYLVPRDMAMIRSADMIVANLLPITSGYPCMGTLMELGMALDRGILVVLAGPPEIVAHPFLQRVAYARFDDIYDAMTFAAKDLQVMQGWNSALPGSGSSIPDIRGGAGRTIGGEWDARV